jgi:hypothetical protein
LVSRVHSIAVWLRPDFAFGAYVGNGRVLNQLKRYGEALACFEEASR